MPFQARGSHMRAFLCIMVFLNASCLEAQEPSIPQGLTLHEAIRLALDRNSLRTHNQALFDERVSLYELASATRSGVE